MKNGINSFISEDALSVHKEYLKTLKLRYSVMEKSFPEIKDADVRRLLRMRQRYRDEILGLRSEIICHELFFNSFGEAYQSCAAVRERYRTESSFAYEISELSKKDDIKYIVIAMEKGAVKIIALYNSRDIISISQPVICIDLCEHSYFLDYGFDRAGYISNLLPYLNLGALNKFLPHKD